MAGEERQSFSLTRDVCCRRGGTGLLVPDDDRRTAQFQLQGTRDPAPIVDGSSDSPHDSQSIAVVAAFAAEERDRIRKSNNYSTSRVIERRLTSVRVAGRSRRPVTVT